MTQSRKWCFTINNYKEEDISALAGWPYQYMCYGLEVGKEGTPHVQGYVVFLVNKRLAACKKLHASAHWEIAKGSTEQNLVYCGKDNLMELGTKPISKVELGAKEKDRWKKVKELAQQGKIDEIDDQVYVKYYGTLKRIARDYMAKPDPLNGTCGLWIYGEPGTGKSHSVITQHPNRYIKPLNKWWDGYQNEEVVHIDEIEPSHATWITPYLKKWTDKWPFDAEVKGGALQIRPKLVVVTTNYCLEEMGFDPISLAALQRRFVQVKKVKDQDIIVRK